MLHLTDDRLMTLAFDPHELAPSERMHLDQCASCRHAYDALALLADDMKVVAQSQPSDVAAQRHYQLFEYVQSQPTGPKVRIQQLVAALSWDSRQQFAMQGLRSVTASEYRLIYATELAEMELMVEIAGAQRHLEGELVSLTDEALTPALLHLHALDRDSAAVMETEIGPGIDGAGRFRFLDLRPGRYRLSVTTALDQTIVIDELDLT